MLSYRHAFHAGNHADVLKHLTLCSCLEHLKKKATPFLYADTHAGAGLYRLDRGYAAETREWESGVARLNQAEAAATPAAMPAAVRAYLDVLAGAHGGTGSERGESPADAPPAEYPGSPELARRLLRPQDRGALWELHPTDAELLKERFSVDRRFRVFAADGIAGLRSVLPPPSRRGLVLTDPSYEVKDDYERVPAMLSDALRRFATGVYIVWYPLLGREDAMALPGRLMSLYRGTRCTAELRVLKSTGSERGLYGSGLAVFNPPWTLRADLEASLPYLAELLGGPDGTWMLNWEEK